MRFYCTLYMMIDSISSKESLHWLHSYLEYIQYEVHMPQPKRGSDKTLNAKINRDGWMDRQKYSNSDNTRFTLNMPKICQETLIIVCIVCHPGSTFCCTCFSRVTKACKFPFICFPVSLSLCQHLPWVLVSATPCTVLYWPFWNVACVFFMIWGCACDLYIIVRLLFVTFSTLWT